jgi:hypothetical protein
MVDLLMNKENKLIFGLLCGVCGLLAGILLMLVLMATPASATYLPCKVDSATGACTSITYPHHEIHEGNSFTVSKTFTVPAGTKVNLGIVTPNTTKWAHMTPHAVCDAALTANLYEADDYSGGTGMTEFNRNRNSGTTSTTTITHTDIDQGSGAGTSIWTFSAGANKQVGETGSDREEFILDQNASYMWEVTATQNDICTLSLDWYEHTNQ